MATPTPANANSPASISPVGPPPATTTACSAIRHPSSVGSGAARSAPGFRSVARPRSPKGNLVLAHPVVDGRPVQVGKEGVDVGGAVGLVVEEIGVLVDVEGDEWGRVPDRIRVLRVADVVEEAALVPVVRRPGPAPAGHARRLEVVPPSRDRPEVALDELGKCAVRVAAVAAEVLEVDLVVLDPADREREVDLERAEVRIDLVRRGEVDVGELAEDLVPLRDVPLVELVVRLHGFARDAVELVEAGLQLPRRDLFVVEDKRRQGALLVGRRRGPAAAYRRSRIV